jgi:hypothetical protein
VAIFPAERDLFFHEYHSSAAYSTATFTLITTLVEVPFTFAANLVSRNDYCKDVPHAVTVIWRVHDLCWGSGSFTADLLPVCRVDICDSKYGRGEFSRLHLFWMLSDQFPEHRYHLRDLYAIHGSQRLVGISWPWDST